MRATFLLSHRLIINYLLRQVRRQSAASAHQVLLGRLSGFSESRYTARRADRNLCQFMGASARYERKGEGKSRLKNWVKICQRRCEPDEWGKLILACHKDDHP